MSSATPFPSSSRRGLALARALFGLLTAAPLSALAQVPEPDAGLAGNAAAAPKAKRGPGTTLDRDCLVCHAGVGEEEAPKLDLTAYEASVHAKEGCVGCHPDVVDLDRHEEKDRDLAPAVCGTCHEESETRWKRSVHAVEPKQDRRQGTCASCHGDHGIVPVDSPGSPVHPLNTRATCGACHGADRASAGHDFKVSDQHRDVVKTMSAKDVKALMKKGELNSGGCTECHGAHDIALRSDPGSQLHPAQVVKTCRECHGKVADEYVESAHGQASLKPGFTWQVTADGLVQHAEQSGESGGAPKPTQPPVCTTCHRVHSSGPPKSDRFRMDVVNECGTCHSRLMVTYAASYHGKATLLGNASMAKCSDCHTAHQILPANNPASSVSPERKAEMCRSCHKGAPENFAGFWTHADPHDGEKYPALNAIYLFMTALLISVLVFFGIHTLLWIIRDLIEAVRERNQPKHKHDATGPLVSRFTTTDRLIHFFVIVSFLGLAATGVPLKFAHASWAKGMANALGGDQVAALLHRIFGVITFGYFFAHIATLVRRLGRHYRAGTLKKALLGPESLVPQLSDVKDLLRNFRYFLGGPLPTWDRWTYWEKFDYWAVFWGVAMIGGSGLVLWFPQVFLTVLPGWAVNVALVIHSDEALLAMGFIFGVHFFNGHLRRRKFPMDPVMFTGSVPEAEYREERGREWERVVEAGQVEARRGQAARPGFLRLAYVFGIAAWLTGLIILGFIVWGVFFSD